MGGNYVGWLGHGNFWDSHGCVVEWTPEASGGPAKPGRAGLPGRPGKGGAHGRPGFSGRMGRPGLSSAWSNKNWSTYLR
ncbi:MAG: 4-fold beta flower protein [Glutamicibacter arilaitensis]|uniref:4-fold beta flower protein n=1 Tax=Glutamicibacter arilaitensis TaxID=256701 RepID=UPI003F8F7DD8